MVLLSDLFFNTEQYDWMLLQLGAIEEQLPTEDVIGHSYLIYGMLKCVAVLKLVRLVIVTQYSVIACIIAWR